MRVLHVFKDCYPPVVGGIELHIHQVVHGLAGFEFTELVGARRRRRSEDDDNGVLIVRVGELGRLASAPVTLAWRRELRERRGDVVHFHMPNPFAELAFLSLARPPPMVTTYHADAVRSRMLGSSYRALQHRFLARAERIIVSSPVLAATSPVLEAHRDRVALIPYGFDARRWPSTDASIQQLRQRHGVPLVLFLGRLVRYKGLHVLVQAMRGVDANLVLVGEGPERGALERLAARAGLGGRVTFVGRVANDERSAYYRAADIFVLPAVTRAEAFGIAMLEAMSFGTPAVSTELATGTSWVNVDGQTGVVVPPDDAPALAAALNRLLDDEALRCRLGRGATDRAALCFSEAAMLEALADVYRAAGQVAGAPGPGTD